MKTRISAYADNAGEINQILYYESDITDDERNNAIVALSAIVGFLQSEIQQLREWQKEEKEKAK